MNVLKKMMILCVIALATLFVQAATETVDGIEWNYYVEDGNAIVECIDSEDVKALTIPSTLGGYPVTSIEDYAFAGSDIAGAVIPASVTNIGKGAFAKCYDLVSVTGGENLKRVGMDAFVETPFLCGKGGEDDGLGLDLVYLGNFIVGKRGCLEEAWNDEYYDEDGNWIWEYDLEIREGTTGMADGLFSEMPITSVIIPKSIRRIPSAAFYCSYVQDVIINEGVEELDYRAFSGNCFGSIVLPASGKKVGFEALAGFDELSNVVFKTSEIVFDQI